MVWGAFSASGKVDLIAIEGKQNSARYISVLEKSLPIYESSRHQKCHFSTGQRSHTHFLAHERY